MLVMSEVVDGTGASMVVELTALGDGAGFDIEVELVHQFALGIREIESLVVLGPAHSAEALVILEDVMD